MVFEGGEVVPSRITFWVSDRPIRLNHFQLRPP
jgi:hypothetical protein